MTERAPIEICPGTQSRRSSFLPFSRPTIEDEEVASVTESLRSGWLTTGPKVAQFEKMFRDRLGVRHAIAVSSATAGLHLAVAALNLQPLDEVIVPSITWASTANVVELCGARTVFADVAWSGLCIDPEDVARRITEHTRAIIPVHYAGQPADLTALRALAAERGIVPIEDAAHALGTRYGELEIGASGDAVVFSFHPIKNITTGEGGMIVCQDEALAARLQLLRFHGVSKEAWSRYRRAGTPQYDVLEPGWKYNMMDLQAALGIEQMKKLERFNRRRTELALRYDRLLAEVPEVRPIGRVPYPATHAWHLYVVRLDTRAVAISRNEFMAALQEEQIGTGLHFPPLHLSTWYRRRYGYEPGSLPRAEEAGAKIFSLPLYPLLREEDQDDVVGALKRVITKSRRSSV
ncbi:MAG: aminotransferase class I/II-fold pyridoxal phosphate-dependent enzyme [Planctomycetota bacterium]